MIDQKAGELGRLLGQSEEYKTLVRASDRMKEDAVVRQLLAEVERIAQDIERATQEGREPAKTRWSGTTERCRASRRTRCISRS